MTDSAALARQLAELDKEANPAEWRTYMPRSNSLPHIVDGEARYVVDHDQRNTGYGYRTRTKHNANLIVALRNNLPAILRALCVMAAVEERNNMICRAACMFTGNYLSQRADELLAECTGAKS